MLYRRFDFGFLSRFEASQAMKLVFNYNRLNVGKLHPLVEMRLRIETRRFLSTIFAGFRKHFSNFSWIEAGALVFFMPWLATRFPFPFLIR